MCWDLDLDLGADLEAHRTPGVEHNGVPDDSADEPAMPYGMRSQGPWQPFPAPWALELCMGHAPLGSRGAPGSTPRDVLEERRGGGG